MSEMRDAGDVMDPLLLREATPAHEAEGLQADLARWYPAAPLGRQSEPRRQRHGRPAAACRLVSADF